MDGEGRLFAGTRCNSNIIIGTSFLVGHGEERVRIAIRARNDVQYGGKTFTGYIFTLQDSEISLCNRAQAEVAREALELENSGKFWDRDPKKRLVPHGIEVTNKNYPLEDIALAYRGELYGEDGYVLKGTELEHGGGWFNIVCARDALAKLDILGIAEHTTQLKAPQVYYDKRTAGLRTMTAHYCDTPDSTRYTVDANEIVWQSRLTSGQWDKPKPHDPARNRKVEAIWGKEGALCLESTRLHPKYTITPFPPHLYPPGCRMAGMCPNEAAVLKELLKECKRTLNSCKNVKEGIFRSYSNY